METRRGSSRTLRQQQSLTGRRDSFPGKVLSNEKFMDSLFTSALRFSLCKSVPSLAVWVMLQTLNCNSLLIPNKPIFAGEIYLAIYLFQVNSLLIGEQGIIRESCLSYIGTLVLCSNPFSGTLKVGRFLNLHYFPRSQCSNKVQHFLPNTKYPLLIRI